MTEDNQKYESFFKDMIEGEVLCKQFGAICSRPFQGFESEYEIAKLPRALQRLLRLSFEFHESCQDDARSSEVECMHRTAIVYEMVAVLNGGEFPEKVLMRLNPADSQSPFNYMNILYYLALYLSMPKKFHGYIKLIPEYGLGRYALDIAVIRVRDDKILYDIECDGYMHSWPNNRQCDSNRQKDIEKMCPGCKTERVLKEQIYKPGSKTVNAMKMAKEFWDRVEVETRYDFLWWRLWNKK